MATRKGGLGRGLDSLIPEKKNPVKSANSKKNRDNGAEKKIASGMDVTDRRDLISETKEEGKFNHSNLSVKSVPSEIENGRMNEKGQILLDILKVEPNRDQPRKQFDEDSLQELADSIRQYGILSPLLVQRKEDYYEIVAGERRWRAAKLAGLSEVPAIIRDLSEQEKMEIALIENIQREDLNPIEEAHAFRRLLDEFHLKQDELGEKISKSRTAVTNSLRLLKLDSRVQQMVIDEMISTGHARAILGIANKDEQYEIAQRAFDEKMSVREIEALIKRMKKQKDQPKKKEEMLTEQLMAIYQKMEENLKVSLGTKVKIKARDGQKGKLEIEYYSQDELERIIDYLQAKRDS